MKTYMKKIGIPVLIIILVILGGILWYQTPVGVLNISANDVSKINIFDGSTGQAIDITEGKDREYFINDLNALQMKRRGLSLGYMGYRFRVTIDTKNGRQITFIVNSANDIRKDPFFYNIVEGEIDFEFIESLFVK